MATATLFNQVGNAHNYTANVTIKEHREIIAGYTVHVVHSGAKHLTIKNMEGETVWTGHTDRMMNPQDLAKFVQEISA